MLRRAACKHLLIIIACLMAIAFSVPALALDNGDPAGISITDVAGGSEESFITVPEGASSLVVDLQVAEASAAMSLGVNFESAADPADPGSWECNQTGTGSLVCQFDSPLAGDYFILVSSLEPADGTLTATYILADQPDNNAWNNSNMAAGETKNYTVTLPEGTNQFKANLHVSFGSAVLFTKAGSPPSGTDYDCTAYSEHGNAQCIHQRPLGGVWYATVLANEDSMVNVQLHYTENQQGDCDQDPDCDQDQQRDRDQDNKPEKDNNNGKGPKDKDDKTNNGKSKNK
jgi:hypothetical protein